MLKKFQKALRINQTDTERYLWQYLRNRRFQGWKFRRQYRVHTYIVDFVCLEKNLVVELDGGQHAAQRERDQDRTRTLESYGFKVVRFWNNEVWENIEGVLETILAYCSPSPALRATFPEGG